LSAPSTRDASLTDANAKIDLLELVYRDLADGGWRRGFPLFTLLNLAPFIPWGDRAVEDRTALPGLTGSTEKYPILLKLKQLPGKRCEDRLHPGTMRAPPWDRGFRNALKSPPTSSPGSGFVKRCLKQPDFGLGGMGCGKTQ